MRRGNILPIAVMAFALVGFLFVLDYSINGNGKWPWSLDHTKQSTNRNTSTANEDSNVDSAIVTNVPDSQLAGAPDFGDLIAPFSRPVVTDTTTPKTTVWPYLGSQLFSSLSNTFKELQDVDITAISFRGDTALIGGEQKKLLIYDGKTVKDVSTIITGETADERANTWPRVEYIAAAKEYWLISVYGSNVSRIYKYDGKTSTRLALPKDQDHMVMESSVWTGSRLLIGDMNNQLYSFNGTTFSPILSEIVTGNYSFPTKLGWNGKDVLVFFPGRPHHFYTYSGNTLSQIPDPDFSGVADNIQPITSIDWNGTAWNVIGQKSWTLSGTTWTEIPAVASTAHEAAITGSSWSGSYEIISSTKNTMIYDEHGVKDISSDLNGTWGSNWLEPIVFGDTYGLASSGLGGAKILIRIERRSPIATVNSDQPYSCYTPSTLLTVPKLVTVLKQANFTDRTFTDLCVSTNTNPQKKFYVLKTTNEQYSYNEKKNIACDHCYMIQAYGLPSGTALRSNPEQVYPFVIGASRCGFDEYLASNAQQPGQLMISCSTAPSGSKYQYYQRYAIYDNNTEGSAYFAGQCSIWDTDKNSSAQDGETVTKLTIIDQQATTRCGNPKRTPLQSTWLSYKTDGFSFKYPTTWFLDSTMSGTTKTFTLHPRNLGSGEGGGGPWNPYTLESLPPKTVDQVLADVRKAHPTGTNSEETITQTSINGQVAVVYNSGPGMCDGEDIYLIGAQHVIHYSTYCTNWQDIDQTFHVE